jgi:hypothetical protein
MQLNLMHHVKVMIFLESFTHCSKLDQYRSLMDILHKSKRASGAAIVHFRTKCGNGAVSVQCGDILLHAVAVTVQQRCSEKLGSILILPHAVAVTVRCGRFRACHDKSKSGLKSVHILPLPRDGVSR